MVDSLPGDRSLISPDLAPNALIEIKANEECRGPKRQRSLGRTGSRDQKLRRFTLRSAGPCPAASVWKLPQISTPANTTNTETTAAETRIESMGIATSFDVEAVCRMAKSDL